MVRIFVRIMKYVVIEQRARKIKRSTQVPLPAMVTWRVMGTGLKGIQNIDDELWQFESNKIRKRKV